MPVSIILLFIASKIIFSVAILHSRCEIHENKYLSVSIIIAMRNEELNAYECIQSLLKQEYDKSLTEIIVIDDWSEDDTFSILLNLSEKYDHIIVKRTDLLNGQANQKAYQGSKKQALKTGIDIAHGDILIFTDADCTTMCDWIEQGRG